MADTNEIPEGIKAPSVSPEAKKSALDELMSWDFMTKIKEQIAGIREKVWTEISHLKKQKSPEQIVVPEKPESVQPKNPNTTPESEVVLNPNAPYQVSGESTNNTSSTGIANSGVVVGWSSGPSVSSNPPPNLTTNSF